MVVKHKSVRNNSKSTKNMTLRQAMLVMNEAAHSIGSLIRDRRAAGGMNPDPRRDIDKECGYEPNPTKEDFKELYDRFGLAARIVNLLPDECFSVNPDVYETERPRDTAFEKKYKAFIKHPDLNFNYYYRKVDALSGIGRFGGLLFGVNDGKPLDTLLDGMLENGRMTEQRPEGRELLYVRAFDESLVRVKTTNNDPLNPRYGMPQVYELTLEEADPTGTVKVTHRDVHWSRILHVAESAKCASEIYADSRLRKVNEPLYDVRKILGGSAEMFWKGGFPGIAATVDPRFLEAGNGIEVDEETITDEMQRFMEGLQRYILGVGFQINSLSPQVADPTAHLMMQFTVIAMSIGIPLRVFMGSEEAKLASGQDMKAWNRRIVSRQNDYLTPKIIRPFVFRLIASGVLPPTKQTDEFGFPVFNVFWPDVAMPDDNEKSTVADRRAAALLKFVTGKCYQVMQPSDFLRFVLGYDPAEIDVIMENIKKSPEIEFKDDQGKSEDDNGDPKKPADSGVNGKPPSDTRVDAIK